MTLRQILANLRLAEAAHLSATDIGRRRSAAQTVLQWTQEWAQSTGTHVLLEIDEEGFINLVEPKGPPSPTKRPLGRFL